MTAGGYTINYGNYPGLGAAVAQQYAHPEYSYLPGSTPASNPGGYSQGNYTLMQPQQSWWQQTTGELSSAWNTVGNDVNGFANWVYGVGGNVAGAVSGTASGLNDLAKYSPLIVVGLLALFVYTVARK